MRSSEDPERQEPASGWSSEPQQSTLSRLLDFDPEPIVQSGAGQPPEPSQSPEPVIEPNCPSAAKPTSDPELRAQSDPQDRPGPTTQPHDDPEPTRFDSSKWEAPPAASASEPWTTQAAARHDDLIEAEAQVGHLDRHDELLELEVLSTYRKVEDHSHGRLNRLFMDEALAVIAADDEHPLRKLLNEEGTDWLSRRADADVPAVNAGHMLSRQALREERFALEDSTYNQLSNHRGETQGYIFEKGEALDLGGVPVERRTAEMWERTKVIPEGTVKNAKPHRGWVNSEDE